MRAELDRLFEQALELQGEPLDSFLNTCGPLRGDVERLLSAHARMGEFLATPAAVEMPGLVGQALLVGDRVGRYTIERIVGSGGGGTVYAARQNEPNRLVALKVMRAGITSESAVARFRREADILARLRHPNIAHVYEAGMHGVLPFFAMEFVDGEPLGQTDVATVRIICDAVHHGHVKGVVHRDLKPSNLLVDTEGRPKVIDFGIARDELDESSALMGTPRYMSPEQRTNGDVDARSDVYSLGVVMQETLQNPDADLSAIIAHASAADANERYASAEALGADLRRYAELRPVDARPASLGHQLLLFARRRRSVFLAILFSVLILVAAVVVSVQFAWNAERSRLKAERARVDQRFETYIATIAATQAALRVGDVNDARRRLEQAPAELRDWEWRILAAQVDRSRDRLDAGGPIFWADANDRFIVTTGEHTKIWDARSKKQLGELDVDGEDWIATVAIHPTRAVAACGTRTGCVYIADLEKGDLGPILYRHGASGDASVEHHVNEVAWSRDGKWLASVSMDHTIRVWDGHASRVLVGHRDRVVSAAFLPDGRLVSGDRTGRFCVWAQDHSKIVHELQAHSGSVEHIAVSADGSVVATASRDQTVRLWDLATWTERWIGTGHVGNVRDVMIDPLGRFVATASYDRTVRVWDIETGREQACLRGHTSLVRRIVFGNSTNEIVSFSRDGTIRFWRWKTRSIPFHLAGHTDSITTVLFSPGSRTLAAAQRDQNVTLWDLDSLESLAHLEDTYSEGLTWLNNNNIIVGALQDMARRIQIRPRAVHILRGKLAASAPHTVHENLVTNSVLMTQEGKSVSETRLFPGARGVKKLRVDVASGRCYALVSNNRIEGFPLDTPDRRQKQMLDDPLDMAISPDGQTIAAIVRNGSVYLFDPLLQNKRLLTKLNDGGASVAFHPSGTRLATASSSGSIRLWDTGRWRQVGTIADPGTTSCVAFSPDGKSLAAGTTLRGGTAVRVWQTD